MAQSSLANYYVVQPTIRASAVLTNSYVAGVIIGKDLQPFSGLQNLWENNQLILFVDFTKGSLTSASIQVEFSQDGTNWYLETFDSIGTPASSLVTITESAITRTFLATGKYRVAIKVMDNYMRISSIGTGTVTNSLLAIDAVIGNN